MLSVSGLVNYMGKIDLPMGDAEAQGKGIAVMTALVSEYLMISDGSQVPPFPQHVSYEKALLMRLAALRKVPDTAGSSFIAAPFLTLP